jgi:glycosyltransferase involved in cell wall biosynthesis
MITYNHEKYIDQAVESVLRQFTSFDVEVIICDDYSTDNTLGKLKKYADRIIIIKNNENLGPWRSLEKTFSKASGKYIALLEGDDYWTDSDKLQHQVNFMENHAEYAMCFTNYTCVDETGIAVDQPGFEYHNKRTIKQNDLFNLICPPTRGVLFRKDTLPEKFPEFHYETISGDTFIFSFILKDKPAFFINQKKAVWRIRNNSLFSSVSDFERRINIVRDFAQFYKFYTGEPQGDTIKKTINAQHKALIKSIFKKPTIERLRQYKSLVFQNTCFE